MRRALLLLGLLPAVTLGAGAFSACLPGDTRPVPGQVYVTARPSPETAHGFTTDDGWRVTFDHVYAGIGDVALHRHGDDDDDAGVDSVRQSDGCASYGDPHYTKFFDFAAPEAEGAQKVGEIYGLGTCPVTFVLRSPTTLFPETAGASVGEFTEFSQIVGIPAGLPENDQPTLHVIGSATNGKTRLGFDWTFLERLDFSDCPVSTAEQKNPKPITDVDLAANDVDRFEVVVHAEELFRLFGVDGTPLFFQDLVFADTNHDGTLDLFELTAIHPPYGQSELVDGGPPNLAEVMFSTLVPRVFQVGGGPCKSELHEYHY